MNINNIEKKILEKINSINNIEGHFTFDNLKMINQDFGGDAFQYVIMFNDQGIDITQEELDYLIDNSDLKRCSYLNHYSSLFLLMINNRSKNLNMTPELWGKAIKKSDINLIKNNGMRTALVLYVVNKKDEEICLKEETIDYLINNHNKNYMEDVLYKAVEKNEDILLSKILKNRKICDISAVKKITNNKNIIKKVDEFIERGAIMEDINKIKVAEAKKTKNKI